MRQRRLLRGAVVRSDEGREVEVQLVFVRTWRQDFGLAVFETARLLHSLKFGARGLDFKMETL